MFGKAAEPLSPFRAGVLLTLARIPRYEPAAIDVFKRRVTRSGRFSVSAHGSAWVRQQNTIAPSCVDSQDVSAVLRKLVVYSAGSWDIVVPGLVQLGSALVEACPAKDLLMYGPLWADLPLATLAFVTPPHPAALCARVGLCLLRDTFARHRAAQAAIVEQVTSAVCPGKPPHVPKHSCTAPRRSCPAWASWTRDIQCSCPSCACCATPAPTRCLSTARK